MKPIRSFLLLIILFFACFNASSQQVSPPPDSTWRAVSAQILGPGGFGSVRFEKTMFKRRDYYYCFGLGYFSEGEKYLGFPVGLGKLFFLKNQRSAFDLSFTVNPMLLIKDAGTDKDDRIYMNYFPGIGFRRFSTENVVWGLFFTPLINEYKTLMPYGGVSIGYYW